MHHRRKGLLLSLGNFLGLPLLACLLWGSGCINVAAITGKILFDDPKYVSSLEQQTGVELSGSKYRVAVLCDAPFSVWEDFDSLTSDLAKEASQRMKRKDIHVVASRDVLTALEQANDRDAPQAIAQSLECNYIVSVNLQSYSEYEDESRRFYRGRALGTVLIYRVDGDTNSNERRAIEVVRQPLRIEFPKSQSVPVEEMPQRVFQQEFINILADEVGRHVYDIYTRELY